MDGTSPYSGQQQPSWYSGDRRPPASAYDSGVHDRPFRLPGDRDAPPGDRDGRPGDRDASPGDRDGMPGDRGALPGQGPTLPGQAGLLPGQGVPRQSMPGQGMPGQGMPGHNLAGQSGLLPGQRDIPASYPPPDPVSATGSHAVPTGSVRGPEYPTIRPNTTSVLTRAARRSRPISTLVVAGVIFVLMIPTIVLLIRMTFASGPMVPGGVVPAVLLTLGLPLTGIGLYALAGAGPITREAWLRPPLAYLPIGLLILMAAGLGAG